MGDHAEAVQVLYDPATISYPQLLELFWESHPNWLEPGPTRVATGVFAHGEEQLKMAQASRRLRPDAASPVQAAGPFWPAAVKHQKFNLQRVHPGLVEELETSMPDGTSFLDTTLAARMHAYLDGFADAEAVRRAARALGLDPEPILDRLGRR